WKLLEQAEKTAESAGDTRTEAVEAEAPAGASAPVSIHELVSSKETGLSRYLRYDAYERRSGLVHLLAQGLRPEAFAEGQFDELGDFIDRPFEVRSEERRVGKEG